MHITEQSLLTSLLVIIGILAAGILLAVVLLLLWVRRFISKMQTFAMAMSDVPGTVKSYGKRAGLLNIVRLLIKLI